MNTTYQDRVDAEDAMKHVFQSEYDHLTASPDSLAGALRMSRERARVLVSRLQESGLLVMEGGALGLTPLGREQALQVLRAHRLYETFLARETGLASGEWHRRAEIDEHRLTPERVDDLARQLGHPRYDPHGDPIPTRTGEMPPELGGMSLPDWPVGEEARVVHVEDEPQGLFAEVARLGLAPGLRIVVEARLPGELEVRCEGRLLRIPRLAASNVSVTGLEAERVGERPARRLADLVPGEVSQIRGLSPAIRGRERNRLLDLGFVPGSPVELELTSPLASPAAYRVRGSLIALRRQQAEQVFIDPEKPEPAVGSGPNGGRP